MSSIPSGSPPVQRRGLVILAATLLSVGLLGLGVARLISVRARRDEDQLRRAAQDCDRVLIQALRSSRYQREFEPLGPFLVLRGGAEGSIEDLPYVRSWGEQGKPILIREGVFKDGTSKLVIEIVGAPFPRIERLERVSPTADKIYVLMGHPEYYYREQTPNDAFAEGLTDPSPSVRRASLQRIWISMDKTYESNTVSLIIRDKDEPVDVRQAAIMAFIRNDLQRELITALRPDEDDSPTAALSIAQFGADRRQPHWMLGAAWRAPTELMKVLPDLGGDPIVVVPALIQCLEHPNQWDFVPAVAHALGSYGKEARAALPKLRVLAESSTYDVVQKAAREAISQIDVQ